MAYTVPFTAVTGATILASQNNTGYKDNIIALWVYTAAGSIAYSNSATTLAELLKPSEPSFLYNDAGGVPSWLKVGDASRLHAKNSVNYNAGDQHITSTAYQVVLNSSVNITITKTSTIVFIGRGTFSVFGAGGRTLVQPVIGSNEGGDAAAAHTSSPYYVPFTVNWYKTGLAPNTYLCQLQGKANTAAEVDSGYYERGRIDVFAFVE